MVGYWLCVPMYGNLWRQIMIICILYVYWIRWKWIYFLSFVVLWFLMEGWKQNRLMGKWRAMLLCKLFFRVLIWKLFLLKFVWLLNNLFACGGVKLQKWRGVYSEILLDKKYYCCQSLTVSKGIKQSYLYSYTKIFFFFF